MSDYQVLLEFIAAITSFIDVIVWPVVAGIALLVFKKPLADLVMRIRSYEMGGHKAEFEASQQDAADIEYGQHATIIVEDTDTSDEGRPNINPLKSNLVAQLEQLFAQQFADLAPDDARSTLLTALAQERLDKFLPWPTRTYSVARYRRSNRSLIAEVPRRGTLRGMNSEACKARGQSSRIGTWNSILTS